MKRLLHIIVGLSMFLLFLSLGNNISVACFATCSDYEDNRRQDSFSDAESVGIYAIQEQNLSETFRNQSRSVQKLRSVANLFAKLFILEENVHIAADFPPFIFNHQPIDYYIFALRKMRI